jgi:hypothetical protein
MPEVLFILPGADGRETASGKEFRHSCSENDPISSLFDVIRKKLGEDDVHLSLEREFGNFASLAAIDPKSRDTLASIGLPGLRVIVGFKRAGG